MDKYIACEQAYKNGYEKGYAEAKAKFERKTAHWVWSEDEEVWKCSNCGAGDDFLMSAYCKDCGAEIE